MAANNFRHALFCAFITLIISYPIIGFNLEAQGINVTLTGADATTIVMVLLAAVIVFLFQMFREQIMGGLKSIPHPLPQSNKEPMAENRRAKIESWVLTGIVVLALFWPFFVSRGSVDLATLVLIYVMLALGLNVVVGLAGLLDLGYVAFYAVGARGFTSGLINVWPERSMAIHAALEASDYATARKLISEMKAFEDVRAEEMNGTNVTGVKAALKLLGDDCGATRPPSAWPLTDVQQEKLASFMKGNGLIG